MNITHRNTVELQRDIAKFTRAIRRAEREGAFELATELRLSLDRLRATLTRWQAEVA